MKVAALFVERGGVYSRIGWDKVETWGLHNADARLYRGPWPVVAHPPCNRWSVAGAVHPMWRERLGKDGGCFASALESVRKYGGVIEHPRGSLAFKHYGIEPTLKVNQCCFGHFARKPTWLYIVGCEVQQPSSAVCF